MMKTCIVDGTDFEAVRRSAKYCSPRCRKIAFLRQPDTDKRSGRLPEVIGKGKICGNCKTPMLGDRCLQKSCL